MAATARVPLLCACVRYWPGRGLAQTISVPRGRAPFGESRHSGFEWLCKHNRLRPIRFVRLDFEHAQSDGKSVNRCWTFVGQGQRSRFLVLTKWSAASGNENGNRSNASFVRGRHHQCKDSRFAFLQSGFDALSRFVTTGSRFADTHRSIMVADVSRRFILPVA